MSVQEIPHRDWNTFCERFTRQHRGALVTIEMARPGEASQVVAHDLPLQGVSLDPGGTGLEAAQIRVGRGPDERLNHFAVQPVRILFEMNEAGGHVGLTLVGADGLQTRLRFRVPFFPEAVDGLMVPAD